MAAIASLGDAIDAPAAAAVWDEALRTTEWQGPPVWIHGDLDPQNVLVEDGVVSAVIDFGGLGVGDPAGDAMVAWKMFSAETRHRFQAALPLDEATWTRGRGWALSHAVVALAYYTMDTNPGLVSEARHWLAEVLDDAPSHR